MKRLITLSLVILALAFASRAIAGPDWLEGSSACSQPDAGSLVHNAQTPMGSGPLGVIMGGLGGNCGNTSDYEDMFRIYVDDPMHFMASTRMQEGGAADFDTQLFLFTEDGHGLLANDDASPQSLLLPMATDGTGQTIPGPGIYLLAITGFSDMPVSDTGVIFNILMRTEISGPDGRGHALPLAGWTGPGETGGYRIKIEGASFVPEPGTIMLLALGTAAMARRRRTR